MFLGTSRKLSKIKMIDAKINFDQHVGNIWRASFANIRALRQIRPTLSREDANKVACAIVSS